jgi:hypothetical protein
MLRSVKVLAVVLAAVTFASAGIRPAAAISVELAKKCRGLALEAHPYKLPGEPGAGSATAQRDYFSECVKQDGNMPSEPSGTNQSKAAPASAPAGSK